MAERNAGVAADRRIDFRIGINLGDVIAEKDDLFGDGVNIAARLEGLAEPGGIVIPAPPTITSRTSWPWASSSEASSGSRTSPNLFGCTGSRSTARPPGVCRWEGSRGVVGSGSGRRRGARGGGRLRYVAVTRRPVAIDRRSTTERRRGRRPRPTQRPVDCRAPIWTTSRAIRIRNISPTGSLRISSRNSRITRISGLRPQHHVPIQGQACRYRHLCQATRRRLRGRGQRPATGGLGPHQRPVAGCPYRRLRLEQLV